MKRLTTWLSTMVLFGVFAIAGVPSAVIAGESAANQIFNYETIFGSLDADGGLKSVRLVNQLRVFGEGDIVINDPAPTQDFRNIAGGGDPKLGDGTIEWSIRDLAGSTEFVSASTPDKDPPLGMQVTYYRNGDQLPGPDAVGKSGTFDVTFDVSNLTVETMQTTITDAAGKTEAVSQQVPLPMVAELQLELPKGRFTKVEAPGADIVTDPNGNLIVRWNMVMVPPIGELTQSFNLRVDSQEFQLGAVRLQGVPVAPIERPFLAFAEHELEGGVEKAGALYGGANDLSSSMSDLHDGTLELVAGMEKLFAGAKELASGLGEAFSGSAQITDGGGQITSGLGQLGGGLRKIRGGLQQVAESVPEAKDGAELIAGGAGALEAGVNAIRQCLIIGGACTGSPATIPDIATALNAGLTACLNSVGGCPGSGGPSIKDLATTIAGGLGAAGITGLAGGAKGAVDTAAGTVGCLGDALCVGNLAVASDCLTSGGGALGCGANIPDVATALTGAAGGISGLADGLKASADTALGGINAIAAGLVTGIGSAGTPNTVLFGLNAIKVGANKLADGIADLIAGLGDTTNPNTLIGGTTAAIDGSDQLTAGASKLTDGSGLLTAGLGRAADGSGRLADGTGQAKDGAGQIEQGTYLINELGLKEIGQSANQTVLDLDRQLQLLKAQDERARTDTLLYGPPSSDQAETVVGGSGVVLTMDALSNRGMESATRAIGVGIGFAILAALWLALRAMRTTPVEV